MKDIEERLKEKQTELTKLADSIALHDMKKIPARKASRIDDEQFKMLYKLKELEEQGLDAKLITYQKVIDIIKE